MQNKIFFGILMLLACAVCASCNSDSFKLEGALSDVGERSLHAIYVNEAGVQKVVIPVEAGRFEMEGVSSNYTVLYLYNDGNKLLTKAVMKNGDKLKLRGTMKHNNLIEMKGSEVNEDWNNFRRDNHLLYEDGKEEQLYKKIEEYVEANGDKMSSLLLLLFDYGRLDDTKRVHELLNMIKEDARPASIMKVYTEMNAVLSWKGEPRTKFSSFKFHNEKDSVETLMPARSRMTLLCFWGLDDDSRNDIADGLDSLYYDYKEKKQLQIADIVLDSDTARWKRTLRREGGEWKHFWAVGGIMNKTIEDFQVRFTPEFMLLDSVGQPVYRGDSLSVVTEMVKAKLIKSDSKDKKAEKKKNDTKKKK